MTPLRRLTLALAILVLVAITWVWWNRPQTVDMAANAPADALIYLEANSVTRIAHAITSVEAWRQLGPLIRIQSQTPSPWWERVIAWTGIGPVRTVVAARAQVAVVMLSLGASEEGETLKVKPDAAIVVETHTSSWRIRSATEKLLGELATSSYGTPSFSRQNVGETEFLIWSAPSGSRRIIATVDGSAVIIGNSEEAVSACLGVRRGLRPSLKEGPELLKMRRTLNSNQALAFGYVPSANAARLISIAAPLLLGRERTDSSIERVMAGAAAKMLGSMGWSSFAANGGIEDRYLFSLQPTVVNRLQPFFRPTTNADKTLDQVIGNAYSQSLYRFESTENAWTGFESAVLSQLDAVSAVVFDSLLKSALLTYGIKEPRAFVSMIGPHVATVRLQPTSERSVLIAEIKDRDGLHRFISGLMPEESRHGSAEVFESEDNDIGAAFLDNHLVLGPPPLVRVCLDALVARTQNQTQPPKAFIATIASATIITYTNDSERVRTFVNALVRARTNNDSSSQYIDFEKSLSELPYTTTETSLSEEGLGRRTQSSFGQFGTLAALLFPDTR